MPPHPKRKGLKSKLKKVNRVRKLLEPVWKGPIEHGITQSMLGHYIACKERFRIRTMEGLKPHDRFIVPLEYGQLWHEAEHELAETGHFTGTRVKKYAKQAARKYRNQQQEVSKWHNVCLTQFPIYMKYWEEHEDVLNREPLLQEETFRIPYKLPSGRVVLLMGKFDAVDYIKKKGIYLQENKSKGKVDFQQLRQQLTFDLQTMMYLIALKELIEFPEEKGIPEWDEDKHLPPVQTLGNLVYPENTKVLGVRYNVVRRPLSGGKGSIRQKKATKHKPAETKEEYFDRLRKIIEGDPDYFFNRWTVDVSNSDILHFKRITFHPLLENLADDFEWWDYCMRNGIPVWDYMKRSKKFPNHLCRHYRLPYGTHNSILEGGVGALDNYMTTGSTIDLVRDTNLFPELEDVN